MAPSPAPADAPADPHAAIRRELYFFTLYRVFEAALLCFTVFGPVGELFGQPRHPLLAAAAALAYLVGALVLFVTGRRGAVESQVAAGVAGDRFVGPRAGRR